MNIKEQDKQTLANFVETLDTIKINIKYHFPNWKCNIKYMLKSKKKLLF